MPGNPLILPGEILIDYTPLDEIVVQKLSDLAFVKARLIDSAPNRDNLVRRGRMIEGSFCEVNRRRRSRRGIRENFTQSYDLNHQKECHGIVLKQAPLIPGPLKCKQTVAGNPNWKESLRQALVQYQPPIKR